MSVPRYTTPTFTLTFTEQGLDLTQATGVYVTFKQASLIITKTGDDLEITEKTISVFMDQEETARFCKGDVDIQANWTTGDRRAASEVVSYDFSENLLQRVIE
jgi:hypothetical protein